MPSKRHRTVDCLQDIIDNIARIERYIDGLDQDGLEKDDLRHHAVERYLERICAVAFRLADEAPILLPEQPWADIRGMGNRLRHAYDQIDVRILWNVVKERLPSLKADVTSALEHLSDSRQV